ncbi:MAG: glutamine-hydrolyzing GMP synthase [Candidatus Melainabacteria bacterium]|nr:glutamine-hydrolyzing GMP synthase [Candidatus Melainabacteria bacterium]
MQEKILILDFGSQYTELIAKRIRKLRVYSEVKPFDYSFELIKKDYEAAVLKGIILSGGPNSIYDSEALLCDLAILDLAVPILGICYGMQLLADHFGAKVLRSDTREYGKAELFINAGFQGDKNSLFYDINRETENAEIGVPQLCDEAAISVWMSHCDYVSELEPVSILNNFKISARTTNTAIAAFEDTSRKLYGVQFHPEVTHSEFGAEILSNFILNICKCSQDWDMQSFINDQIDSIRNTVGEQKVLLALSGGVDSSTLAFLLKEAIGDQLICMFIDHGFMRKNEPEELMQSFQQDFGIQILYINAKEKFMTALAGVADPEQKRKIIGREFIYTFQEEVAKLKAPAFALSAASISSDSENAELVMYKQCSEMEIKFLAQGTLYSDLIESSGVRIDSKTGKRVAASIKSHHNVGGLPDDLKFTLIEPLKTLFKDEVRELAKALGVPEYIVRRHPFPGPGLAIRVLGELTEDKLKMVADSDFIVREELIKANAYDSVWQIFTAVLPVKSVGVMGDKRTYAHPIVLRAVTSEDAMTADWARMPYELLAKISNRIINEVDGVNRVVYDITSKPPATIEWE